jgi:hypothetical protein
MSFRKYISALQHAFAPAALALALLFAPAAGAHEIPNDVKVQMFVKPAGERLQLLLRVPMQAMQDVDFPRRGVGLLDLGRAEAALRTAALLWFADNIEIYDGDRRIGAPKLIEVRASLPSDRSFTSFDEALAHVTGAPLPPAMEFIWSQGQLDALFEYPIESERAEFSINPALARLGQRVVTSLRYLPPGGAVRAYEYHGSPGLLRLDPRWYQAAARFAEAGFLHILDGADHLLFILCLVIPFRRFAPLVLIVTAFTVAHSITLIAAAFGYAPDALWFPPLVELLIAISIVYMALENIVGGSITRRWIIAFVFGLVHGFGFSFALRETLQFAGSHLVTSLLSFNLGVELGQLAVLAMLVPVLGLLFRYIVAERIGTFILSVLVAHTGWHWMLERGETLGRFPMPALDAATLAGAMRWAMAALVVAVLLWLANKFLRRYLMREGARSGAATSAAPDHRQGSSE